MEPVEFPCIVFCYSFWLLVGISAAGRKNLYNYITYLYQAGIDVDWLWPNVMVLWPGV